MDRLAPIVETRLKDAGFEVKRVQVTTGFARFIIRSVNETTELDLAADARLFPLERSDLAPTLSGLELAVDKVLAVFGRAEPRDFVDLQAVLPKYGLEPLFQLAAEKDLGFTPAVFADMCGRFDRLLPDEFAVPPGGYELLRLHVEDWRSQALDLGRQWPTKGLDQGPDLGLSL